MVCEECHERPATVHVVTQINGHREERWLCEQCARSHHELQAFNFNPQFPVFSFQNLLSSLFDAERNAGSGLGQQRPRGAGRPNRCEVCGTTLADFRRTGLLGCAHCYEQFAGQLEPVIRQVQGSNTHRGKRPAGQVEPGADAAPSAGADGGQGRRRPSAEQPTVPEAEARVAAPEPPGSDTERLARLRTEMQRAVAEERYEDAARLRDRIREIEAALAASGNSGSQGGHGNHGTQSSQGSRGPYGEGTGSASR